jgi:type III secretion protein U
MAEKTEKATPKKLKDARKKGQVAKAQDLPSAFTFVASVAITLGMTNYLYQQMSAFTLGTFNLINQDNLLLAISDMYWQALMVIFICSIPVMGLVSLLGIAINFLAVGPTFAPEVFKPDIKKFNPVENLKQKFKMKTLVELLKSLFKISVAGYIIYTVVYASLPVLITAVSMPMTGALMIFYYFLMEVCVKVGLLFLTIAILDFVYQRRTFAKEMKMEKFEVKQEYKNTEGDPLIKGKRRQLAQEIAYQEGPGGAVRKAQAVVTNPQHIAVAIAYHRETDPAPYILAMGSDELAKRIIKFAEEYNVPIMRNIPLARRLWDGSEVNDFVPEDTYEAIVEILKWIASLQPNYDNLE